MRRLVLLAVMIATALPTMSAAASKSYDVVPYSNCVAATTLAPPYNDVIQYYRNTLDSLSVVSVWIGDTFEGQPYNVGTAEGHFPYL